VHACYRFLILALLLGLSFDASARHHGHGPQPPAETGVFDYYLLSLSWSPTYCETHAGDASQCSQKHFGFVLHGLWPQYAAGGYPQDCATDQQLTSKAFAYAKTIFPSPKLVDHEWSRHGTCSGLDALSYFKAADRARQGIRVPAAFVQPVQPVSMSASDIAAAFRAANPAMQPDSLAVACSGPELSEVRICLGRDLTPVACGKGVSNSCRNGPIRVPSVR